MINEIIKKRRSIRSFKDGEVVTDDQIKKILEAAMLAPSACNSRPWKFIVVKNKSKLNEITAVHPYTAMLNQASAAIIVLADTTLQIGVSEGFFPQDCAAATQNILLQAAELGIGTCWCGVFPKESIVGNFKKIFDLPEHMVPFCCIAVGVPNEDWGGRGFYDEKLVEWIN